MSKKLAWLSFAYFMYGFSDTIIRIFFKPEIWAEKELLNRWLSFIGNIFLSMLISFIPMTALILSDNYLAEGMVCNIIDVVVIYFIGVFLSYRLIVWRNKHMKTA